LIDTHSHIYSEDYRGEIDEVIIRAKKAGVSKIITPNIDSSSIKPMLDIADSYSDFCFPLIGIHPTSVKEDFEQELEVFNYWLNKREFFGIGEIGIDLYWDKTFVEEQEFVFRQQLKKAAELKMPVVIHVRDSFDVVMKNLKLEYVPGMKGIFHCFSGNYEQAKEVLEMGFKIGVGGTVTFKNSGVDALIADLKPEDLVLETDSPYLAPVPYRGKRNESCYIPLILQKISEVYSMPAKEIELITDYSAIQIFEKLKSV
jgi:TatD DNase family protein